MRWRRCLLRRRWHGLTPINGHEEDRGFQVPESGPGAPTGVAYEHGELVGQGVKAFGFDTTLAPVMDLALPVSAGVMGTRVAAQTAEGVVEYARGFLAGLAAEGVAGCGKHFPGLGGGTLDSHVETPAIRAVLERDLAGGSCALSRAAQRAADGDGESRGLSRDAGQGPAGERFEVWITTVLRKRVGYRGLVFSDDLEMGGILKYMPMEEAVIAALRAGMDLLEICHSPELILRAFEAMIAEGERSAAFQNTVARKGAADGAATGEAVCRRASKALTARQFEALRARILRFGETVSKAQASAGMGSA